MSNGEKAKSPNYSILDRRVRKLQKQLARQLKDSKRRNITRIRIAKLHNKIADIRKDFLHKLSTKIVSENQVIVLEDLNVSGMIKNRKLSRLLVCKDGENLELYAKVNPKNLVEIFTL